jgi:hypothetical protein
MLLQVTKLLKRVSVGAFISHPKSTLPQLKVYIENKYIFSVSMLRKLLVSALGLVKQTVAPTSL